MQSKLFPLWWMQESTVVTPKLLKANSSFPPHQLALGSQPSHTGFHGSSQWMRSYAHTQYFLWSHSFNRLYVCLMLHLQSCEPQPLKNCKTFSRTIPLGLTDLWLWASLLSSFSPLMYALELFFFFNLFSFLFLFFF